MSLKRNGKDFTTKKEGRLTFIPEGIYHAFWVGPNMENHRRWWPEMTIDYVVGQLKTGRGS